MPISVFWDDENEAILRMVFMGPWRWEELFDRKEVIARLCATRAGRVDIIANMPVYRPASMGQPANAQSGLLPRPVNGGLTVMVVNDFTYYLLTGHSRAASALVGLASSVSQARVVIAASRRGEPLPEYVAYR